MRPEADDWDDQIATWQRVSTSQDEPASDRMTGRDGREPYQGTGRRHDRLEVMEADLTGDPILESPVVKR
jgi:hypothetical protein